MDVLVIHPRLETFLKQVVKYYPKMIVDVGAHVGMWSRYVRVVYPSANYFLIEANDDCEEELRHHGFRYEITLLGEKKGIKKNFYKINGGDCSGNSVYRERTTAYDDKNCTAISLITDTLDNVLSKRGIECDFLKLDVQGSELDILKGSLETLKKAEFVLLEIEVAEFNKGRPSFAEIIKFMDEARFEIFDLIELKYMPHSLCLCKSDKGRLNEMDILFVKKDSKYKKDVDTRVGFVDH